MFAVYGLQGRLATGPLDRVRDLGAVRAVARLRRPAAVEGEDQPGLAAVLAAQGKDSGGGFGGRGGGGAAGAAAAEAYAQTATGPRRQPLTQVQQLMSRAVITVPLAATVGEAWRLLERHGIGQAPVLSERGLLVGLIGRADLLRGAQPDGGEGWAERLAQPVGAVMWSPVPGAQLGTSLREAAQLLLDLHLPGLPVLDDDGRLQGFLSRSDLLQALTHEPPLDLWG